MKFVWLDNRCIKSEKYMECLSIGWRVHCALIPVYQICIPFDVMTRRDFYGKSHRAGWIIFFILHFLWGLYQHKRNSILSLNYLKGVSSNEMYLSRRTKNMCLLERQLLVVFTWMFLLECATANYCFSRIQNSISLSRATWPSNLWLPVPRKQLKFAFFNVLKFMVKVLLAHMACN